MPKDLYSTGNRCIIAACKNSLSKVKESEKNVSFYRLPTEAENKIKWIKKCKLANVPNSARICSEHFKDSDFESGSSRKRLLKDTAVPSLKLWFPKNSKNQPQALKRTIPNVEKTKPAPKRKKSLDIQTKVENDYDEIIQVVISPLQEVSSKPKIITKPKMPRSRKIYKSPSVSSDSDYDEGDIEVTGVPLEERDNQELNVAGKIVLKRLAYQREYKQESFYDKILRQHNNTIPDKETIIKIIEQKINEHSKLIEDQKYMRITSTRENKMLRLKDNSVDLNTKENQPDVPATAEPTDVTLEKTGQQTESEKNVQPSVTLIYSGNEEKNVQNEEKNIQNNSMTSLVQSNTPKNETVANTPAKLTKMTPHSQSPKKVSFEKKKDDCSLEAGNIFLCKQNLELKNCNTEKDKKIKELERQLEATKVKLVKIQEKLNKKTAQAEMYSKSLSKMLTPNQIKLLTEKQKKVVWTAQEMLTAFTIRFLSKRCYNLLRDKLNYPLPGSSSLQRWATAMSRCSANGEGDQVMYFPNATDDVVIEGTLDEINKKENEIKVNILRSYLETEAIETDQEIQPEVIFIPPNEIQNFQWELIENTNSDNTPHNLVLTDEAPVVLQGEDGELFLPNTLSEAEHANAIEVFNNQIIRDIDMGYHFMNETSSDSINSTSMKRQPDHSYAVKIIDCSEGNILQANSEN